MEAKHIKTGAIGEQAVLNHLKRKGFLHLESNFKVKTGEIDLIVEKDEMVHFVEVKTVSHGTGKGDYRGVPHGTASGSKNDVSRGTYNLRERALEDSDTRRQGARTRGVHFSTMSGSSDAGNKVGGAFRHADFSRGTHRPEDNVHKDKLRKLTNTIQVWLSMNKYKGEWQLDVAAVYLDREARRASVRIIDNIIVE